MNKENFLPTGEYFLRLIRYGIGAETPDAPPEKPDGVVWEDVFLLSKKHYLSAVTYLCVKELKEKPDKELLGKWEHAYAISVHIDIRQAFAWEELKQAFSEKGLRILPLKGLCIKKLYPDPELRLMSDLDILYEKSLFSDVKKTMLELGYEYRKETAGSNHQIFERAPDLHVEMHSDLLPGTSPLAEYYADAWSRAHPAKESSVYHFSREDEYIFLLIHAWKHFQGNGGGIRSIVDFYLFLKQYEKNLDKEYISRELKKADSIALKNGIQEESPSEFEKFIQNKTEQWFKRDLIELDQSGAELLMNGVYGRKENAWRREYERKGKIRYLFSRVFPPFRMMKMSFPILKKFPVLLPFCWCIRLFRGIFFKGKEVNKELHYINSIPKNKEMNINKK